MVDRMRDLTIHELEDVGAGISGVGATGQGAAVLSLATELFAGRLSLQDIPSDGCPAFGFICA